MAEHDETESTAMANPADDPVLLTQAPDAATFVMLAVISVILLGMLGLILRLRFLARHPKREVTELEALSQSDPEE